MRAEKELAITNKLLADAEAAMHFRPSGLHAAVEAARAVRAPDEASQADAPANGAALAPNGHDAAMGQDYGLGEPAPIENAAPLEGSVDDPIHVPRPMPERHIAAG